MIIKKRRRMHEHARNQERTPKKTVDATLPICLLNEHNFVRRLSNFKSDIPKQIHYLVNSGSRRVQNQFWEDRNARVKCSKVSKVYRISLENKPFRYILRCSESSCSQWQHHSKTVTKQTVSKSKHEKKSALFIALRRSSLSMYCLGGVSTRRQPTVFGRLRPRRRAAAKIGHPNVVASKQSSTKDRPVILCGRYTAEATHWSSRVYF